MQHEAGGLDQLILAAVSRDFESFESIVEQITTWTGKTFGEWDTHQIELTLIHLISHHLLLAYSIHADPPFITVVNATAETIRRHWFLITTRGMERLNADFQD